jgi:hypothetical protein
LETRRTNPSFLSESEAIRERERTHEMVRSIVGCSPTTNEEEKKAVVDQRFWESWKGRIVRSIVLSRTFTKSEILKATKLKEEQFEKALKELFQADLITESEEGKFRVSRDLYKQCMRYFEEIQEALVEWVQKWKLEKREFILDRRLSHFYLVGRLLSRFSEGLIEHAHQEILVASPFVKRCHISDALMSMSEKGISVKLLVRCFDSEQFKREVISKGVAVTYDESVHAKLIVVDRSVAIVSSMNFYAGSSGGACWEAGIATLERHVVYSVIRSILAKI